MPHAALPPVAPTDRAALLPPPPTATNPRGTLWRTAIAEARAAHTDAASSSPAHPLVPIAPYTGDGLLERELSGHSVVLCASAIRPSQGAPRPGPVAPFKPSRIDPLNREPTKNPSTTVPFKPSRTDPLNRDRAGAHPRRPATPVVSCPSRGQRAETGGVSIDAGKRWR
jgi:hypothetical protein